MLKAKVKHSYLFKLKFLFYIWVKKMPRPRVNSGTLTYKVNALPLSYLGQQPVSLFSLRKPVRQTHPVYHKNSSTEWPTGNTIMQWDKDYCILLAQQKEPWEAETPLYNERKTAVVSFPLYHVVSVSHGSFWWYIFMTGRGEPSGFGVEPGGPGFDSR